METLRFFNRVFPILGLTTHQKISFTSKCLAHSLADEWIVIDNQHGPHHSFLLVFLIVLKISGH